MSESITPRLREALAVLAAEPQRHWSPAGFAYAFWPDKNWGRSNGPWGLGPDASGRHGGRILTRLHRLNLVTIRYHEGGWDAQITTKGLAEVRSDV